MVEIRNVIGITITINDKFPANGITSIKQAVSDYYNGGFPPVSDGLFETDGIQISEDVFKSRLYTPINSVPGHIVTALTLEDFAGGGDVDILVADFNQRNVIQSLPDITVTVV